MTEKILDDVAPGPKRRKTEKAVIDAGGTPVILAYDEVNDRTVMVRGDITGGMRVIGMLYSPAADEYIPQHVAEQGGMNKAFINTDNTEELLHSLLEQMRMMNLHLMALTDMQITKDDLGDE